MLSNVSQMSTAMMSAPSAASLTAWLRPCPRAAPVMKATRPSSLPMSRISFFCNGRGDGLLRRPQVDRGELLLLEAGPGPCPQDPAQLEQHDLVGDVKHAPGSFLGEQQRSSPGPQLGEQLDEL